MNKSFGKFLPRITITITAIALLVLYVPSARSAAPASDNASNTAYDSGWTNGTNGGSGFGVWTLDPTSNNANRGFFIGSSSINVSGESWGIYSNAGTASAVRNFGSAVATGERFSVRMDTGSIASGKSVGFGLRNITSQNVIEYYFAGGSSNYTVVDGTGTSAIGPGYTTDGLDVAFTFTSPTFYFLKATRLSDSVTVRAYRDLAQTDKTVTNLRLFSFEPGSGSGADQFFNSLAVTAPTAPSGLVINEIDYDNPGNDNAEYIEIKNTSGAGININDYDLLLIQGNVGGTGFYRTVDLPNTSIAAGGYYVVCGRAVNVPNCNLEVAVDDLIQNGDPDAVALAFDGVIVDTVSYGGSSASPFTEGTGIAISKNDNPSFGYRSLSRINDGADSNNNNADFLLVCSTPGTANVNTTSCNNAYAATTGSDTNNNCANSSSPCATVSKAIARAGTSDTINVAGGTYAESPTLDGGTMSHWAAGGGGNNWTFNDFTVNSGAILNAPPDTMTLSGGAADNPNFTNSGTFNAGSGTFAFSGQNNISGRVYGTAVTTFNNVTLSTNGSGVFGVDFYDQSPTAVRAVINGILTLNSGTFVAHAEVGRSGDSGTDGAPTYGSASTLRYNNGGTFGSAEEWKTGTNCGDPGVPYNVEILNNTTVNIANSHTYAANANKRLCGNLTISSGSILQSTSGTLTITGNWTNNGSLTANSGTATFNGSTAQTIAGSASTTFHNLIVNNGNGVTLNVATNVDNTLTLTSGRLTLGSNNLTLGPSAPAVAGTLNSSNMVVADGSGYLCKRYGTISSFNYPIGDNTSGADYSPVTAVSVSGTGSGSPSVCFNVTDAVHPNRPADGTTYISRYWTGTVLGGSIGSLNYGATFNFVSGETTGAASMNGKKWNGSNPWIELGAVSGTSFSATGQTSFSDFTAFTSGPLNVTMSEISAVQDGNAIRVSWETASELNNRGFNVWRAAADDAPQNRLNAQLIPSLAAGSPGGQLYNYSDAHDLVAGTTYYYWVEAVGTDGNTTLVGPVPAEYRVPTAVAASGSQTTSAWGASIALLVALALMTVLITVGRKMAVRP